MAVLITIGTIAGIGVIGIASIVMEFVKYEED